MDNHEYIEKDTFVKKDNILNIHIMIKNAQIYGMLKLQIFTVKNPCTDKNIIMSNLFVNR